MLSRCGKGETRRGGTTDIAKMHEIAGNSVDWAGIAIMAEQGNRTQTLLEENRLHYLN